MKKILIADEDDFIREVIGFRLENEGIKVEFAIDGEEVLQKIQRDNYNLLLMELMLPIIEGFTVIQKIKENNPQLPIIVLSAKNQEMDVVRCLEMGVNDFIGKPFRPLELLARIKRWL